MIGQIAAATRACASAPAGHAVEPRALDGRGALQGAGGAVSGRIDLGLGRAPGTDPVTSYALRRHQDTDQAAGEDDFLQRFQELLLFESRGFPPGHPFQAVHAMPKDVALPPIWLLDRAATARNWRP